MPNSNEPSASAGDSLDAIIADYVQQVEAGQVPQDWAKVCRMTDALGMDRVGTAALVLFCQEAWD